MATHTDSSSYALTQRPDSVRKGRGAISNATGRYETKTRFLVQEDWPGDREEGGTLALRTTVGIDSSRTIITRNNSPDIPFDQSINPYRGCEHGCVYCFARPTHAYLGFSSGLDFETRLFTKPNAPKYLEKELSKPGYEPALIGFGTNTDPYQPIERKHRITRALLEVLDRASHPIVLLTKSALILRDLDILASMAKRNLVCVVISVTTLDRALARVMEPRATTPARRIDAVRALANAGVPVHVLIAPIIPAISDTEIEPILGASAKAGASGAGYVLLRLPLEIKDLFTEWLETHFPDRVGRVLSLIRQTHGGALYRSAWGVRKRGTGPYADLICQRVYKAKRRFGLSGEISRLALDYKKFRAPFISGNQLCLL